MATNSSVVAWRIPGTGEPGVLLSMGSHRVRHNWSDLAAAAAPGRLNLKKTYIINSKCIDGNMQLIRQNSRELENWKRYLRNLLIEYVY